MALRKLKGVTSLLGIALLCAVLLAACGGSASSTDTSSTDSNSSSGSAHEPVTLTLGWWYDASTQPGWNTMITGFEEKYPWITVEPEVIPYGDYYAKLGAWVAADSGPDVIAIETGALWEPYEKDLVPLGNSVKPLTEKVNNPSVFCPERDCEKGIYGIGVSQQGYLLYSNKPVLEAAGLDPNSPPKTMAEMSAACKKIEAIGKTCWAVAGKDIGLPLIASGSALNTASEQQMQELAEGKASWSDPEFKALLTTMQHIGEEDWYPEGFIAMESGTEPLSLFVNGEAAFISGLIGDGLNWSEIGEAVGFENLGVVNFPSAVAGEIPGVEPGPLNGTLGAALATAFAVPKWSSHEAEAKLLMAYALEPQVQKAMIQQLDGPFPALKTVQASWSKEAVFGEVLDLVKKAKSPDLLSYIGYGYLETLTSELQQLSTGETTVDAAASALDSAAEAARTD